LLEEVEQYRPGGAAFHILCLESIQVIASVFLFTHCMLQQAVGFYTSIHYTFKHEQIHAIIRSSIAHYLLFSLYPHLILIPAFSVHAITPDFLFIILIFVFIIHPSFFLGIIFNIFSVLASNKIPAVNII